MLVVAKPAGVATMGALPHEPSLVQWSKDYLKNKYQKPGNVFLGVVSRLDSFVSGVLVFARTSKAASRLSEQFRKSSVTKKYLAVVHGRPRSGQQAGGWQELRSYLRKNDRLRRVESFERPVRDAQEAWLEFRVLRTARNWSLVEIDLKTGRKHQIRAQFSDAGHPIYGDRKYDSAERMGKQIALHAKSLTIQHPTLKTRMDFEAPLPENWGTYGKIVPLLAGF